MTKEIKNHVNLMICTPGHSLMGSYVKSLLETANELNKAGITWGYSNEYSSHVGDAREMTLNGGPEMNPFDSRPFKGDITYDKIMWIDSDIAWKAEDVIKLYASDKDVISGAYLLANGSVVAHKEKFGRPFSYEEVKDLKEIEKIYSAGFGFICVKNGVFESLSRPWFQASNDIIKGPDGQELPFAIMGEDTSWCHRVNELGFEVYFDPTVQVTHHKMMKLTWEGIAP
jgi:hypothetical protein